jgi:hypothetical protein
VRFRCGKGRCRKTAKQRGRVGEMDEAFIRGYVSPTRSQEIARQGYKYSCGLYTIFFFTSDEMMTGRVGSGACGPMYRRDGPLELGGGGKWLTG